jgi:outer membrane protein assembly factor BamB
MPRRFLFAAALMAALCPSNPALAARTELIPDTTAAQHGLARPWFAQLELDQGRGQINATLLYEGVLYIQTNRAVLHAIDAETGKTLWSKQIGLPDHPSMPPDVRGDLLATINGSRLFLVNRKTGELLCQKDIKDAPGGGPALSAKRIFVPITTGLIISYCIEPPDPKETSGSDKDKTELITATNASNDEPRQLFFSIAKKTAPMFCQSFGRALVQPLVTRDDVGGEYVVWPTDRGYLNFGRVSHEAENNMSVKYRLQTGGTIVTRPAYLPPDPKLLGDAGMVYAASCDGFLYAIQEESGDTVWRFSTGEPIVESPAVINDHVYITTQIGGMHCLDRKTGRNVWYAEGIAKFISATKTRIYATDALGQLVALNAASGARLDVLPVGQVSSILANSDTDRIYLIDNSGLIQCLHETEQLTPLQHNKERKDAAKAGLTPPEPKKEVKEPVETPKREHTATPKPAAPREKAAPKPKKEKPQPKPKPTRKSGKKGANAAPGNQAEPFGGPGAGKPKKQGKNDNNPF